ncbi:MAG: biotin-dependent carboxyltransferase family protein [Chitinophagaceae bacterium]|nr:biotin-dependent carboxyltransferase family protein [Chitinophagaceae bacterium]
MSLTIIKAGLLDTVQDLGRSGFGSWGINPGGAMDRHASQIANILTGNEMHEALIEMHFPGPQILFEQNALISITGADFTPVLNDQPVSLWQPILVRRNTILHFSQWKQGARCYLSVHGGFAIDKWLNSYSTNTKAAAGGWRGRRLEKGDEINFGESSIYYAGFLKQGKDHQPLGWRTGVNRIYDQPNEIFFIQGHEWNQLHDISKNDLLQEDFLIHSLSDRMGYHLTGMPLTVTERRELLSSGVSFGTIQLLPNGQLIVLMADHQTTGGYPRVGHIISAHLPKLAQLRPGDHVRFSLTDIQTAEELYFSQQQDITILKRSCSCNLNKMTC